MSFNRNIVKHLTESVHGKTGYPNWTTSQLLLAHDQLKATEELLQMICYMHWDLVCLHGLIKKETNGESPMTNMIINKSKTYIKGLKLDKEFLNN